jgi:hypothetical protein
MIGLAWRASRAFWEFSLVFCLHFVHSLYSSTISKLVHVYDVVANRTVVRKVHSIRTDQLQLRMNGIRYSSV